MRHPRTYHISRALVSSGDSTRDSSIAGLSFDCTNVNGIMEALSAARFACLQVLTDGLKIWGWQSISAPCYAPAWKYRRNASAAAGTCTGIEWLHPRASRSPGHSALPCTSPEGSLCLGLGVHSSQDPFSNTDSQPVAATAPASRRAIASLLPCHVFLTTLRLVRPGTSARSAALSLETTARTGSAFRRE